MTVNVSQKECLQIALSVTRLSLVLIIYFVMDLTLGLLTIDLPWSHFSLNNINLQLISKTRCVYILDLDSKILE